MGTFVLPKAEDWQHRVGSPGYFVTKDGRFQMLLEDDGGFVICTMRERKGMGYLVVYGPKASPQELGIPNGIVEAGEALMLNGLVESLIEGEKSDVQLAGELALQRKQ